MHALRMEHASGKDLSYGSYDFSRPEASRFHGGAYGFLIRKEHDPEQAVLTDHASHTQRQNSQKKPYGTFPLLNPDPEKRNRHVSQDEQSKIGKIGNQRIAQKRHIPFQGRRLADPSNKIYDKGNGGKGDSKGRKHVQDPIAEARHIHNGPVFSILLSAEILPKQNAGDYGYDNLKEISRHISEIRWHESKEQRVNGKLRREIIPADTSKERNIHPMRKKRIGIFQHLELCHKQIQIVMNGNNAALPENAKYKRRKQDKARRNDQIPSADYFFQCFYPR